MGFARGDNVKAKIQRSLAKGRRQKHKVLSQNG